MPMDQTTNDQLIAQGRAQTASVLAELPASTSLVTSTPVDPTQPLAGVIDHTLLKPEATPAQIAQLCQEAQTYHFASVCVNPGYVVRCVEMLAASDVPVCTVVGFPLGATTTAVKVYEVREALTHGAREIDVVLPIGLLRAGELSAVYDDLCRVVGVCHEAGALCKIILETALLTDVEKVIACLLAVHVGADYVKTSTGFAASGATVADVALLRATVGPQVGVKASGGIRTAEMARALLAAGATRIGASASVQLVTAYGWR